MSILNQSSSDREVNSREDFFLSYGWAAMVLVALSTGTSQMADNYAFEDRRLIADDDGRKQD